MIWVKDRNEDREDHDVDILNIIQKVQDTVIHLDYCTECLYDSPPPCQRPFQTDSVPFLTHFFFQFGHL